MSEFDSSSPESFKIRRFYSRIFKLKPNAVFGIGRWEGIQNVPSIIDLASEIFQYLPNPADVLLGSHRSRVCLIHNMISSECDIRMDFDTNEYLNIFVSRK